MKSMKTEFRFHRYRISLPPLRKHLESHILHNGRFGAFLATWCTRTHARSTVANGGATVIRLSLDILHAQACLMCASKV
jgi:hypothetical protein